MNFVYEESMGAWTVSTSGGTDLTSNLVTVTNTSPSVSITTAYSYAQYNSLGETTMQAVVGGDTAPGSYAFDLGRLSGGAGGTLVDLSNAGGTLGNSSSATKTQKVWLMFTTRDNLGSLSGTSTKVGTLHITLAAAD